MNYMMNLRLTQKGDKAPKATSTDASRIYEELRRDLLFGTFSPGAKLPIDTLRHRYGVGPIPMREALNRLVTTGFVAQADQRGFYVPELTPVELEQLTATRCWIHPIVVRETLAHGDQDWEEELVLSAHRLFKLQRYDSGTHRLNPQWETQHRTFHLALIAGCPSRWMNEFYAHLFDHADLYRHQYISAERSVVRRDVDAEHRALLAAAVARDEAKLVVLLDAHVRRTTEVLLRQFPG